MHPEQSRVPIGPMGMFTPSQPKRLPLWSRSRAPATLALVGALICAGVVGLWAQESRSPVKTFRSGPVTLEVFARQGSTVLEFVASNTGPEEIDLQLNFKTENMRARPGNQVRVLLRPRRIQREVATLTRTQVGKPFRYSLGMRVYRGNPRAKHRGTYLAPFSSKKTFTVANAFYGSGAHKSMTPHAVDFSMPVGTAVHAARTGVVARVKSDSNSGGADPAFAGKANYIAIRHKDGSYAFYLHLRKDGVDVQVGQLVFAGWKIGTSGNTGWSTGPHLHLHVAVADGRGGFRTVPWKFQVKSPGGQVRTVRPRTGLRLRGAGE